MAILSTDRGRAHTAGDILGTAVTPADWSEALVLDVFSGYDLPDYACSAPGNGDDCERKW